MSMPPFQPPGDPNLWAQQREQQRRKERQRLTGILAIVAAVAVIGIFMAVFGGGSDTSSTDDRSESRTEAAAPPEEPDDEPGRYEQTWQPAYLDTTCQQWIDEMTEHERFVAAADMLVGQRTDVGIDTMPDDDLIEDFQLAIHVECVDNSAQAITTPGILLFEGSRDATWLA